MEGRRVGEDASVHYRTNAMHVYMHAERRMRGRISVCSYQITLKPVNQGTGLTELNTFMHWKEHGKAPKSISKSP